jgi:hypothetical protein
VRRVAWIVLGVVALCLGVGSVWGVDLFLVDHNALGTDDGSPVVTPTTGAKGAHQPMTTSSIVINVVGLLLFTAILVVAGRILVKRRAARDAVRLPGEVDLGIFGQPRRRWTRDRTLDPIGGPPPGAAPAAVAEPADPRLLPADVARQVREERARIEAELAVDLDADAGPRP